MKKQDTLTNAIDMLMTAFGEYILRGFRGISILFKTTDISKNTKIIIAFCNITFVLISLIFPIPVKYQIFLFIFFIINTGFFVDYYFSAKYRDYIKILKSIGFKNVSITSHKKINENDYSIIIQSDELLESKIEKNKEYFLNLLGVYYVSSKRLKNDPKKISIILSKKDPNTPDLGSEYLYQNYHKYCKKPFDFVVGIDEEETPIIQNMSSLPHLLIAGATNSGKSVFFKQLLYTLYSKNKKHINMSIIDLKRGVETASFKGLKGVTRAIDEHQAHSLLKKAHSEMMERFSYMEANNLVKIDPIKHKKPMILVAIDEASELFGVKSPDPEVKKLALQNSELVDKIAKLGRAASVHLIISTQKVIKETVSTSIRSNLRGRICFKTESQEDSRTVLGNTGGFTLENIPGRNYWRCGTTIFKTQALFLSSEELEGGLEHRKKTDSGPNKITPHQPKKPFNLSF